jgi:hypothetical protein
MSTRQQVNPTRPPSVSQQQQQQQSSYLSERFANAAASAVAFQNHHMQATLLSQVYDSHIVL